MVRLSRLPLSSDALRDWLLALFFVALACSISASEIFITLLLVTAVPWRRLATGWRSPQELAQAAHEIWTTARPLRGHPLTPPFLALITLTILSASLSGDPAWSLWIARDTLRIATFYLVLWCTRDSDHAVQLWRGFLVTLALMAGYGLAQASFCRTAPNLLPEGWVRDICLHPARVRGPFSIYMTFGGVLMLGTLVFVAFLANVPWRSVWWMLPAAGLTVAALAVTYARNAWLGLVAGTLGLIVTGRRAAQAVAILGAMTLVVAALTPGGVGGRVRSIANLQDVTFRDRVAMWRSGLAMIRDYPVLGVGPGEVRAWYPHYRRPEAVRPSTGHLHNSPIQIAAERGVPALLVWIWLWVVFFREGGRIGARLGADRFRERALVAASLAGVAGFLVAGLFEYNFGDGEVVRIVYALMAAPSLVGLTPRGGTGPSPLDGSARAASPGGSLLARTGGKT